MEKTEELQDCEIEPEEPRCEIEGATCDTCEIEEEERREKIINN